MLGAKSIDYGSTSVKAIHKNPLTNLMVMAYFSNSAMCCVVIYLSNLFLVVRVKHIVFNCNSKTLECAITYVFMCMMVRKSHLNPHLVEVM